MHKTEKAFLIIKKYIDDNFTNSALTLSSISKELLYNPKYISGLFKKKMNIGLVEYINTIRIQYACTLINQGFTSVKEIAALSGYRDALYFSKVFKKKMGVSPKQYIFSLHWIIIVSWKNIVFDAASMKWRRRKRDGDAVFVGAICHIKLYSTKTNIKFLYVTASFIRFVCKRGCICFGL